MIVSLHVATGAAAGALAGSRVGALLLGPPVHLLGDRVPQLAVSRGPFDRATLGAFAASAPDLEHIFPALRPGGRKLFHGRRGWHKAGSFPANVQLVLAGAIVGYLLFRR